MATRQAEQRAAQLRRLVLRMQRVLDARRRLGAYRTTWAAWLDGCYRVLASGIVDEMRRVEGATRGDAA